MTPATCLACHSVMTPIAIDLDDSVTAWLCRTCNRIVQPLVEWNPFSQRFDTELTGNAD